MSEYEKEINLIENSGLFDKSWYLSEYPDVKRVGMDPIFHYLRIGASLSRNPSPQFITKQYLDENQDVKASGINPLIHYILYGKKEGRSKSLFEEKKDENQPVMERQWGYLQEQPIEPQMQPISIAFAVTESNFETAAGDFYTAYELGQQLHHQFGYNISYLPKNQWYDLSGQDILVALVDSYDLNKIKNRKSNLLKICWVRNWFIRWSERECFEDWDIYLCSSIKGLHYYRSVLKKTPKLLRIASNHNLFRPIETRNIQYDYSFTGSYWDVDRDIEQIDPTFFGVPFRFIWERLGKPRKIFEIFQRISTLPFSTDYL